MTGVTFGSKPRFGGQAVVLDNDPRLVASPILYTTQATVDFGHATNGEDSTATATVAASWVTANSRILCQPAAQSSADHAPEDAAVERLTVYAANIVPGVGFDLVASAPNGTWGRYLVNAFG